MTNEETQLLSDAVKVGFPVLGTLFGGLIGALTAFLLQNLIIKTNIEKMLKVRGTS